MLVSSNKEPLLRHYPFLIRRMDIYEESKSAFVKFLLRPVIGFPPYPKEPFTLISLLRLGLVAYLGCTSNLFSRSHALSYFTPLPDQGIRLYTYETLCTASDIWDLFDCLSALSRHYQAGTLRQTMRANE